MAADRLLLALSWECRYRWPLVGDYDVSFYLFEEAYEQAVEVPWRLGNAKSAFVKRK